MSDEKTPYLPEVDEPAAENVPTGDTAASGQISHPVRQEGERAGFVALAGPPNAGKSTLLNRVLGQRLSISSPKPQTTRNNILGIRLAGPAQIMFLDTPGIHSAHGLMHERMVGQARQSVQQADVVCWMLDARQPIRNRTLQDARDVSPERLVVALNKVDLVPKPELLPKLKELADELPGAQYLPISALKGIGVEDLVQMLGDKLPEGPWLYDEDVLTDQSERFLAAELVREQLFVQLQQELPYRVAVRVDEFVDRRKKTYIDAIIFTDSDSSKAMIVGKRGRRIREVGSSARARIEEMLDRPVYLELTVRVRKGWREDPRFLDEMGL